LNVDKYLYVVCLFPLAIIVGENEVLSICVVLKFSPACMQFCLVVPHLISRNLLYVVSVDASGAKQQSDSRDAGCKKDSSGHVNPSSDARQTDASDIIVEGSPSNSSARTFTYRELVDATGNFRRDCFLGEGGFGKVYKGRLPGTCEVGLVLRLH